MPIVRQTAKMQLNFYEEYFLKPPPTVLWFVYVERFYSEISTLPGLRRHNRGHESDKIFVRASLTNDNLRVDNSPVLYCPNSLPELTFRYICLMEGVSEKLIGYLDCGSKVTLGPGETFTVDFGPSNLVLITAPTAEPEPEDTGLRFLGNVMPSAAKIELPVIPEPKGRVFSFDE